MSDGHRSGRSAGRVSCKSTELKLLLLLLLFFIWPQYSVPREWKTHAMQYKKVQKPSCNELLLLIIIIIIMITNVLITMAVLCDRSRGTLHSLATWIEICPGLVGKQWLTIELSRWQSSHRRRYSGQYGSHHESRENDPIFSIQVQAYSSRKSYD